MSGQNPILLQTKLHRPPLPHVLVERSRLVEWLNQGIDHPLTLVVAPAGYGKTTLIGTWLNRLSANRGVMESSLPSAWLSLDENDSDLIVFLGYFIAALRTIFNEACGETLALIQARQQPPQTLLYTTFCNELAELPGDAILVLDDYQFIHGKTVHNLLSELVRHWPKPLHLVLISRIDPPIPITRLRAKGMIREIRVQDLRFTTQETATYLSQERFVHINQSTLLLMEERFDGWRAVCPWPGPSFTEAAEKSRRFGSPINNQVLIDIDSHDWKLYHIDEDYSETHNLADEHRDKLIEMVGRWYAEAGKYQVFPIDSTAIERINA